MRWLLAILYVTAELLEDAGALDTLATRIFTEEMTFKVEDSIVNGSGAGQPLGILNSGAALEVTKDSGDSGLMPSTTDVLNMWSRMWPSCRQTAVWLINSDIEPGLYPMALGSPTGSNFLYTPPGKDGNPYGLLFGRPVIPVEYCAEVGSPGDIILADLSQYLLCDKGTFTKNFSIHVRFLTVENAFRFTYRVDAQPTWKKPLAPKNGTNTRAPFVYLSSRS